MYNIYYIYTYTNNMALKHLHFLKTRSVCSKGWWDITPPSNTTVGLWTGNSCPVPFVHFCCHSPGVQNVQKIHLNGSKFNVNIQQKNRYTRINDQKFASKHWSSPRRGHVVLQTIHLCNKPKREKTLTPWPFGVWVLPGFALTQRIQSSTKIRKKSHRFQVWVLSGNSMNQVETPCSFKVKG